MKTKLITFAREHRLLTLLLLLALLGSVTAVSAYVTQTYRYACTKCGYTMETTMPQPGMKCPRDGWPMMPR